MTDEEFNSLWIPDDIAICPEGMALLKMFFDTYPTIYQFVQPQDFTDLTNEALQGCLSGKRTQITVPSAATAIRTTIRWQEIIVGASIFFLSERRTGGNMTSKKQILHFGRDSILMETRLPVLESSGFQCHGVSSIADLTHSVCVEKVDAIMLCHSLTPDDVQSVLTITAKVNPELPVLRLTQFIGDGPIKNEHVVNVNDGPYRLLGQLTTILDAR